MYAEKGKSGNYTPITQAESATSFDCYEAKSSDEQVPLSYAALQGGTKYDNFDTNSSLMYDYTPLPAAEIPAMITGYRGAGRLNKGDFKWTFDNATEDTNYGVVSALKSALQSYTGKLIGIFGE